jgi:integrase/recombinase XerD
MEEIEFYELSDFRYHLETDKRLSKKTIESYMSDLKFYAKFLKKYQNVFDVADIDSLMIEKYILSLKRKDLSPQSIARKITAIKEFHKFLYEEHITKDNPSKLVSNIKKEKKLPEVLTIEEINKMISSIDTSTDTGIRNRCIMEVLYGSGLRVSELCDLKLSDIHFNSNYLSIIGKGDKEREVPIGEEEKIWLRRYIEGSRNKLNTPKNLNVFINYKGDPLSRQSVFKFIKALAKNNGIEKEISPHTIRHSFATHLLSNGVDLRFVQELLGHEDISTTQIYTHLDNEQLKNLVSETHPLARNKEE